MGEGPFTEDNFMVVMSQTSTSTVYREIWGADKMAKQANSHPFVKKEEE